MYPSLLSFFFISFHLISRRQKRQKKKIEFCQRNPSCLEVKRKTTGGGKDRRKRKRRKVKRKIGGKEHYGNCGKEKVRPL